MFQYCRFFKSVFRCKVIEFLKQIIFRRHRSIHICQVGISKRLSGEMSPNYTCPMARGNLNVSDVYYLRYETSLAVHIGLPQSSIIRRRNCRVVTPSTTANRNMYVYLNNFFFNVSPTKNSRHATGYMTLKLKIVSLFRLVVMYIPSTNTYRKNNR